MANKRTFRGNPGRGYQAGKKNPGEKSKIIKDSDIVGKTSRLREVTRGEKNKAVSDFKKMKEKNLASSAKKSSSKSGTSNKKATTKTSTAQAGSNIKKKNFNVGVSKGGVSFNEAFRHFRKKGAKEFTWNGKRYTTEVK